MARAAAAAGVPHGRLQQRREHRSPRSPRPGCAWWLQALPPRRPRPLAEPLLARAVDAGAAAVVLTVDTPVVGTQVRRRGPASSGTSSTPRCCGSTSTRATTDAPGAEKATDLGPARPRPGSPSATGAAGRGQGRAARRRRPPLRRGRRRGGLGLQPRRPPARPARSHRRGALAAGRARRSGERRRGATSTGESARGLDVLAALALGADAVFLGRPVLLALAADGAGGRPPAARRAAATSSRRRCACRVRRPSATRAGPRSTPLSHDRSRRPDRTSNGADSDVV